MKVILFVLLAIICFSCKKEEEKAFSIEPHIEFRSFDFGKCKQEGGQDSLNLKFYIRDGDFDLGLDDGDISNHFLYFSRLNGKPLPTSDFLSKAEIENLSLITYKDRKLIDTLPSFKAPYNCTNWEVVRSNAWTIVDTVYFQVNNSFFNLVANIYLKSSSGDWQLFDFKTYFLYPNCALFGFNERFPHLDLLPSFQQPDGKFSISSISKYEGILTYTIRSYALKPLFSGKKIKLKLRIKDRALHKSNEIETTEIQF